MTDKATLTTSDIADQTPRRPEAEDVDAKLATQERTTDDRGDRDDRDERAELLDESEAGDLRRRWTDIQAGFVDRPKEAVSEADELVADTIKRLATGFAKERGDLEDVWSSGGDVSTEDLRVALQRYRSFFERLLNA